MPKSLNICDANGAEENIRDLEKFGDPDQWACLCKAWSHEEGWMKSTKVLNIDNGGCLVLVTTQQRNPDGSYALSDALAYVPDASIVQDVESGRRFLVATDHVIANMVDSPPVPEDDENKGPEDSGPGQDQDPVNLADGSHGDRSND